MSSSVKVRLQLFLSPIFIKSFRATDYKAELQLAIKDFVFRSAAAGTAVISVFLCVVSAASAPLRLSNRFKYLHCGEAENAEVAQRISKRGTTWLKLAFKTILYLDRKLLSSMEGEGE
jgi:hypothetical protein